MKSRTNFYYLTACLLAFSLVHVHAHAQEDPCSAPLVFVDGSCTTFAITAATTGAAGVADPSCGDYLPTARDMWYRVVVPASANVRFNVNQAAPWTIWNAGVAVYRPTGTCPALSLTQLWCATMSVTGSMARINLASPTIVAGEVLYVRVFEENGDLGNMSLCVIDNAPVAPANDNPCGAIAIPNVGANVYSNTNGATATATDRTGAAIPAPGCNYSNNDVWYKTVVPSSGTLQATLRNGTMNANMAAYRRSSPCAGFTLIRCDAERGPGTDAELNLLGLTPGDTIYLRVYRHGSGSGTFTLTTQDLDRYNNKSNDCRTAKEYCGEQAFYQHLFGDGDDDDTAIPGLSPGCLGEERNTMWIKFNFNRTTTFRFTIQPFFPADYDWALYGPIGLGQNCSDLGAPIRCSFTQPNAAAAAYEGDANYTGMHPNALDATEGNAATSDFTTGDGYVQPLAITPDMLDRDFYLRVDNWTRDPSGFRIDFHGTAQPTSCVSVLGITLNSDVLALNAYALGKNHTLQWSGLPEQSRTSELLWCAEGMDWQHLATVDGSVQAYSHDQSFEANTYYYRVVTELEDGSRIQSNVATLTAMPDGGGTTATLYPNPSRGRVQLQVASKEDWPQGAIVVMDMAGRTVWQQPVHLVAGSQSLSVDLDMLAVGQYVVRLVCKDRLVHLPFTKF